MAQTLQGIVSSDKRDKTITVSITYRETHPLYRKQYSDTRKYTAHDENNEAHIGDKVEIVACRPYSKTKTYKLVKVLERSHGTVELKEDINQVEGIDNKTTDDSKEDAPIEELVSRRGEREATEPRNDGREKAVRDGGVSENQEEDD